jgi:hypothetical protein
MNLDDRLSALRDVFEDTVAVPWDRRIDDKDKQRLWKCYDAADPVQYTKRYMGKFGDPSKIQRRINAAVSVGQGRGIDEETITAVVDVYAKHLLKAVKLSPVEIAQLKCAGYLV